MQWRSWGFEFTEIPRPNIILNSNWFSSFRLFAHIFHFKQYHTKTYGACRFLPLNHLTLFDISLTAKLRNFNGFPLRISFFWRYPTSMKLNELSTALQSSSILQNSWRSDNFSGIDGFVLSSVVKAFNFTPILIKSKGTEFGYKAADE